MNNLVQRINFFSRWLEAALLARDNPAAARSAQATRSGMAISENTSTNGLFRSPDMPRAFWISAFFFPQGRCNMGLWHSSAEASSGIVTIMEDNTPVVMCYRSLSLIILPMSHVLSPTIAYYPTNATYPNYSILSYLLHTTEGL